MDPLVLPCDCVSTCEILVVWEIDEYFNDPHHFSLDIYTRVNERAPLLHRLQQAWKMIRGKDHYVDGLVLYREKAVQLRNYLTAALDNKLPESSSVPPATTNG